jgi:hypothetical protein
MLKEATQRSPAAVAARAFIAMGREGFGERFRPCQPGEPPLYNPRSLKHQRSAHERPRSDETLAGGRHGDIRSCVRSGASAVGCSSSQPVNVREVPQADSCTADEEARRQEKARDAAGNTSGASNTASATTQASGGGINGSYSTTFPLTENPISEGGSWTNGGATGLGWANVQTTPGLSFGTSPVNAGTYLYADPTAVLKNAWAQDQQVQATVKVRGAFGRACCKEVELLIRMTIARNSITGYELNCSVVSAGPYLTLVRWNGPLNNFTYIVRNATTSCVNGDVLKLTATAYRSSRAPTPHSRRVLRASASTTASTPTGVDSV